MPNQAHEKEGKQEGFCVIGSFSNDAQARSYPVETQVGSLHLILRLNIPGAQGDT
jgi:hypothetical protein